MTNDTDSDVELLTKEMRWYRSKMLKMAEDGERGTDVWDKYYQIIKTSVRR